MESHMCSIPDVCTFLYMAFLYLASVQRVFEIHEKGISLLHLRVGFFSLLSSVSLNESTPVDGFLSF